VSTIPRRLPELASRLNASLLTVLRIGRWETSRSAGTLDRRTALVIVAAILVGGSAGLLAIGTDRASLDDGIYRVSVEEDHPYHDVVRTEQTVRVVEDPSRADIVVYGGWRVSDPQSSKERAALSALRDAIQRYNAERLRDQATTEQEEALAFPVQVELRFEARSTPGGTTSFGGTPNTGTDDAGDTGDSDDPTGSDDGDDSSGSNDGDSETPDGTTDEDTGSEEDSTDGSDDGSTTDDGTQDEEQRADTDGTDGAEGPDGGDGDTTARDDGSEAAAEDDGWFDLPDLGDSGLFGGGQQGTPAEIQPPFPFQSLLLAFLFIVPMNFVIQAYGSTIMNERLNRRGELLLVAPVSAGEIVAGKTLPYLTALVAFTLGVTVLVGGHALSIAAVIPLALLFLAATFVGGMFARSFKELTFVTVAISVFLTTYAFVPAIFTDVTPIALISPLTLVVMDLEGSGASLVEYVFSTGPVYCSSFVLFGLGVSVYREEDMFTQRPMHLKALDAFGIHVREYWHVALFSAVLIPFVFLVQLLALATLFPLSLQIGIIVLLVVVSCVEEVAKSVHIFAAFEHDRFERTVPVGIGLGVASGIGFFLAEKAAHLGQLVGLDRIELAAVYQHSFAVESIALLLIPVVLHSTTASVSALGARRGGRSYLVGLFLAILLHTGYNLGVIALVIS
jgi:ABC-type Na+ efflux pump permease subunit